MSKTKLHCHAVASDRRGLVQAVVGALAVFAAGLLAAAVLYLTIFIGQVL
jgi:hypothetical protein